MIVVQVVFHQRGMGKSDTKTVRFSRVPCIGEYVSTDDQVFVVRQVVHPLNSNFMPTIRVELT